jgi:hypothetical protein
MTTSPIYSLAGSAVLALALSGCPGQDEAHSGDVHSGDVQDPGSPASVNGAESPTACWDALQEIARAEDVRSLYGMIDPGDRDAYLEAAYRGGYGVCANWADETGEFPDRRAEYEALLAEHGVQTVEGNLLEATQTLGQHSAEKVAGLKDRVAFLEAVHAFAIKHSVPGEEGLMPRLGELARDPQVDGDWARVTIQDRPRAAWLHRVEGRWYISTRDGPQAETSEGR